MNRPYKHTSTCVRMCVRTSVRARVHWCDQKFIEQRLLLIFDKDDSQNSTFIQWRLYKRVRLRSLTRLYTFYPGFNSQLANVCPFWPYVRRNMYGGICTAEYEEP